MFLKLFFYSLTVFVFAFGVGLLIFKNSGESKVKIISGKEVLGESKTGEIVVDVDGAVVNPGVYRLSGDLRVGDAVGAAGGLRADADSSRVNLAAKISDGQKVYVPAKQEQVISEKGEAISQQSSSLVSINSASEGELDALPAVGPVTAGKIINGRPYSTVDELLSKKAVTKSVFEKIKGLISL